MRYRVTCGWCNRLVDVTTGPTTCPHCFHRADLPRLDCTCARCAGSVPWIEVSDEAIEEALRALERGEL